MEIEYNNVIITFFGNEKQILVQAFCTIVDY